MQKPMALIYSEKGGGKINVYEFGLSVTWPFSRLSLYSDKLIITVLGRTIQYPLKDIKVRRKFVIPYIGDGVLINPSHGNSLPPSIFWSLGNAKKIVSLIEQEQLKLSSQA